MKRVPIFNSIVLSLVLFMGSCLRGGGSMPSLSDTSSTTPPIVPPTATIVVDVPVWYTSNRCNPNTSVCYFPELGMSETTGYAPFPVLFQGGSSTPKENIVKWSWNFGAGTESDPHGRTIEGMNAAHVFETPGTYQVTLAVRDYQANTSTSTITVTVLPPTATTYYVDSVIGDDTCNGTSMSVVNGTLCPWKTATKAFSMMARPSQWAFFGQWRYKPGDRILFKRGQTFDSEPVNIGHGYGTQGYAFGAYGNSGDPKPIIRRIDAGTTHTITVGQGTGYISFSDLEFNFLNGPTQAAGFFISNGATLNMLFLRCDFLEPSNGAIAMNAGGNTTNPPANIFVVDSTFQQPTTNTTATTLIFAFGTYGYVLLGNTFDHSGNHISYNTDLYKVAVVGNVFNRPAYGRTALRITDGDSIYIADNSFLGWIDPISNPTGAHNGGGARYNFQLINLSPNGTAKTFNLQNVIFERNIVTNFEMGLSIVNAGELTVRNNLFISPSKNDYVNFISLSQAPGVSTSRPLTNLKIVGNTFISNGTVPTNILNSNFIKLTPWTSGSTAWGDNHRNINISNNIFSAISNSKMRALVLSGTDNNLLGTFTANNNLINIPSAPSGQMFMIGATPYDLTGWRSASGKDSATISANPNFVSPINVVTHTPDNPSAVNNVAEANAYKAALHLTPSSILNTGFIFNADSYYDFAGTARYTTDGKVDIGAYEH